MAVIGRLFAVFFGFLAACIVASIVVLWAIFFSGDERYVARHRSGRHQHGARLRVRAGQRFRALARADPGAGHRRLSIRHILAYAVIGGVAGLFCYLGFIPFDTVNMTFNGIVRRHLEVMVGAGILGGVVYWMIAGRNAGAWRTSPPAPPPMPPLPR
jgi:hypothetical protein